MLAQQLQQGVLDELPGRAGREERRALYPPSVADGIPPLECLEVEPFGVCGNGGKTAFAQNSELETFDS